MMGAVSALWPWSNSVSFCGVCGGGTEEDAEEEEEEGEDAGLGLE